MHSYKLHLRHLLWLVLLLPGQGLADDPLSFVSHASYQGGRVKLTNSKDGELAFMAGTRYGEIMNTATMKPLHKLDAGVVWSEASPRAFSCWTFTPDGRYLVTGSAFTHRSRSVDASMTNVGRIQVWDVRSGKLAKTYDRRLGSIDSVAISEDGTTVIYSAARHEIDGP